MLSSLSLRSVGKGENKDRNKGKEQLLDPTGIDTENPKSPPLTSITRNLSKDQLSDLNPFNNSEDKGEGSSNFNNNQEDKCKSSLFTGLNLDRFKNKFNESPISPSLTERPTSPFSDSSEESTDSSHIFFPGKNRYSSVNENLPENNDNINKEIEIQNDILNSRAKFVRQSNELIDAINSQIEPIRNGKPLNRILYHGEIFFQDKENPSNIFRIYHYKDGSNA